MVLGVFLSLDDMKMNITMRKKRKIHKNIDITNKKWVYYLI